MRLVTQCTRCRRSGAFGSIHRVSSLPGSRRGLVAAPTLSCVSDESLVRALERLALRSGTIDAQALAQVHPEVRLLTLRQYRVMALLSAAPEGLRVGDLARRTSTRPQATGRIVDRLEAAHLVWRERGALADKRGVTIRLTETGRHTWTEMSVRRRELLAAALEGVDLPPETEAVLETIAAALESFTTRGRAGGG